MATILVTLFNLATYITTFKSYNLKQSLINGALDQFYARGIQDYEVSAYILVPVQPTLK